MAVPHRGRRASAGGPERIPDHYTALGLVRSPATAAEAVRAAYRRRALLAHPDKGGSDKAFFAVHAAFRTLSCPRKRAAYDAQLTQLAAGRRRCRLGASDGLQPSTKAQPPDIRSCALERLERLISVAPKDQRRELLDRLPGPVSQALLTWMSARRATPTAVVNAVRAPKARRSGAVTEASGEEDGGRCSCSSGSDDVDEPQADPNEAELAPRTAGGAASVPRGRPWHGRGCQGVHRVGSQARLYQASVFCLNLVVASRSVEAIEKAVHHHTALTLLKGSLDGMRLGQGAAPAPEPHALADSFRRALAATCEAAGLEEEDLGLSFRPVVSALAEVGRQIHGRTTTDLDAALAQRARLLAAKQAGWHELRSAWVEAMAEAKGSVEEAEAAADAAWMAHASCRARATEKGARLEERRCLKLAAAVQAVQRALKADGRRARRRMS